MNDTNKAENGFWNGWIPKTAALVALFWKTRKLAGPALENAEARARNGWGHVKAAAGFAGWWLKKQMARLFLLTLLMASVTGILLFIGLAERSRAFVAVGGLVWIVYLIALWILIKGSAKAVKAAIEKGTDISGSMVASVLRKVGLSEGDGEALKVKAGDINAILGKGFVVLPGFAEMFFLLALMPSLTTLLFVGIVILGAMASGLISAHIGDTMVDGWKLVKRVNFILFLALAVLAAIAFFLPKTFAAYANPGALDAWLVDPHWTFGWLGTVIVIGIAGVIAWILAGRVEGETGRRLTRAIPILTIIAAVLAVVMMSSFVDRTAKAAESTYEHVVGDHGKTDTDRLSHRPSANGPVRLPAPGSSNGMKMPKVDYKTGGEPRKGNVEKPERTSVKVVVPEVKVKKKRDGLDTLRQNNAEIEALLGI